MKELVRDLRKQGFQVDTARNGHYRVVGEKGSMQISMTPSLSTGVLNAKARLKRKLGYKPS